MQRRKLSLIIITAMTVAALTLVLTAYAAINVSTSISSSGSIVTSAPTPSSLSLYSDSACTVPLTPIDWGSISPGGTVTKTIYIKNTQGTAPLTLSMTTDNWSPANANGPLALTWDKEGTTLAPGKSTSATLTLTVSPSITGINSFGVQITISGTG